MNEPVVDALGRPLKDLRISLIDLCNYRCPYCMPAEIFGERYEFLKKDQLLSFDEIERLVRAFLKLGVTKVKLTGGEPLLRDGLPDLIHRLSNLPGLDDLALITNGHILAKMVRPLKRAGLKRLNVSLDALDEATYGLMNGRGYGTAPVLEGIRMAIEQGFAPVKINMVVIRGVNDAQVMEMVDFFKRPQTILRFIEFMDVGNRNRWSADQVVPSREILARIGERYPLSPASPQYRGEVAERYVYDDGSGEVGFISSVTQPFCGDCTRARISADGQLFTCLFSRKGLDLRPLLRTTGGEEELALLLSRSWGRRRDRYSEDRAVLSGRERAAEKVEMYHIGG